MEDEILTIAEAAQYLKISQGHVRKLVREGEIPVIRRGKRYSRYRKSDLVAFLDRYYTRKEGKR